MTHRVETILETFTALVDDLATTGTNVKRGLVYSRDMAYALSVDMGAESPSNNPNVVNQRCFLDIDVTAYVKGTASVDTMLNQIHAEVYDAVMNEADPTLGLAYVTNVIWMGRAAPSRDALEQKIAQQTAVYRIQYEHSYGSVAS